MIRAVAVSLQADGRAVRNSTHEEALVVPILRKQLPNKPPVNNEPQKMRLALTWNMTADAPPDWPQMVTRLG